TNSSPLTRNPGAPNISRSTRSGPATALQLASPAPGEEQPGRADSRPCLHPFQRDPGRRRLSVSSGFPKISLPKRFRGDMVGAASPPSWNFFMRMGYGHGRDDDFGLAAVPGPVEVG